MENQTIDKIKSVIESYYQKGNLSEWKNRDFEDLSFDILRKTKVLISVSTLKRIFGKRKTSDTYTPQNTTIDALQAFISYISPSATLKPDETKPSKKYSIAYIAAALVVILVIATFIFTFNKDKSQSENATIALNSIEGINNGTAFFDLKIPNNIKEDIKVYFGDFSDTVVIQPNQQQIAHYYKIPGIFHPEIIHHKKPISKPISIKIPTRNWVALGTKQKLDVDNQIYPIEKKILYKPGGYLHATHQDLAKCGIDTTQLILLRLYYYDDFNIGGDDFQLKLRLKNTQYWPGVQCNNIIIIIKCNNGIIQQYFPKHGCSYWMECHYSEIYKRGQLEDLSAFCLDLSKWTEISIMNQNKKITFFADGDPIYEQPYKQPLGEIDGIEIHFYGTGYLDDFYLASNKGHITYMDHFDKNN